LRCLNLQPSQLLSARRHHFPAQPDLQIIPIEKIQLPLKSRDELPPILAGLQWVTESRIVMQCGFDSFNLLLC
jgi:hypothetical protein